MTTKRRDLFFVVLAAGESTRINSSKSKVLHLLLGKPVLHYAISVGVELGCDEVFVVVGGSHKEAVEKAFEGSGVVFVHQAQALGTGHAVLQVGPHLQNRKGTVVVVPGDAPLLRAETLRGLLQTHTDQNAVATVLTADMPDPTGYGRVIRKNGQLLDRIVEHHDADQAQLRVKEVCAGVYAFDNEALFEALPLVDNDNPKGEYYLPKVLEIIQSRGGKVFIYKTDDWTETIGVNTRLDFEKASRALQNRIIDYWRSQGVGFVDPNRVYVEPDVRLARDVVIYPGVSLMGKTAVGEGAVIMPNAVLADVQVGPGERVKPGYHEKGRL